MIRLSDLRLSAGFGEEDIIKAARREGFDLSGTGWKLDKLSLDARKKPSLHYTASVTFGDGWSPHREKKMLAAARSRKASIEEPVRYSFPECGTAVLRNRPVIVGAGPAGLFAALWLAKLGYAPIVLERGRSVAARTADVERYWKDGSLDTESNVQFGEGGAGTFSDGKLHTQVKDRSGRLRRVLEVFAECGASPEILYWNRPHIGTDVLKTVVTNLSGRIRALGGEIFFETRVDGFVIRDGKLCGVEVTAPDGTRTIDAEAVILAIGHSARDTFAALNGCGVPMTSKDFAVGVRVQHPQDQIQLAQHGVIDYVNLPVADYRLAARSSDDRGVYSFCMCPGGQVVDASSETGRIAVNGMSNSARDGRNANSAIIVSVGERDFKNLVLSKTAIAKNSESFAIADSSEPFITGGSPLLGLEFQRILESAAWRAGRGKVPVQLLGDFAKDKVSTAFGDVLPDIRGRYEFGSLREVFPEEISAALIEGFSAFGGSIAGFDRPDAVLAGVESRTSSPVRILRQENFESAVSGLFPCGEGAGYAGGITSAAADGIKVAEEIIRRYRPWI